MNSDQAKTLDELMAETGEPVTTAFLVFQTPEGQWVCTSDYEDKVLNPSRQATFDDIVSGCAAVQQGCQVQQTALATIQFMEQRAIAAQQAMAQQQASANVAKLIDPTKLRNPKA